MHMSDIFLHHRKAVSICQLNYFDSMKVEDKRCVYEGEDAFLRLPTSFSKSVCYKMLSLVCLTIN